MPRIVLALIAFLAFLAFLPFLVAVSADERSLSPAEVEFYYLLRRQLGAGATGKVYEALDRRRNALVAVKFLRKSYWKRADVVERFRAESAIVSRLSHPGIVAVHGLGRTPAGGLFIVMDLVPGGDLGEALAAGPIDILQCVRWICQAARAIDHAHRQGVIHCDLKPSNLLLGQGDRVLVTDFGLARVTVSGAIDQDQIAGTPAFMAPEQIDACWGSISPRTDVYGLGAVLFTLLCGRAPHEGRQVVDVLAQVVSGRPISPVQSKRAAVPGEIARVCHRALAKNAAERFQTAADLAKALDELK